VNNEIIENAAKLGKWLQAVRVNNSLTLPGLWQPELILKVLIAGIPSNEWKGMRVLDIGACNGGLSIELARLGAHVHAVEPNPVARRQFAYAYDLVRQKEDLSIQFEEGTLFSLDRTKRYDIVMFLGLVYHFRYPQLVLDYLGGFNADQFIISSQTHKSEHLVMQNRKEATPQFYSNQPLAGYHPSRPLLRAMIEWAGFRNVRECVTPQTGRDFEDRVHQVTNSAYFVCEKGTPVEYEQQKNVYM
jgi:SAM-dependent methyltransferase